MNPEPKPELHALSPTLFFGKVTQFSKTGFGPWLEPLNRDGRYTALREYQFEHRGKQFYFYVANGELEEADWPEVLKLADQLHFPKSA